MKVTETLKLAKLASKSVALASAQTKNRALGFMADELIAAEKEILTANAADLEAAKPILSPVMLDRLKLDGKRLAAMAEGVRAIAALPDPVGNVLSEYTRPDGLKITKISVPLGVIAIIYESRPNVTSDAAALALKSGNAVVLKIGKEALLSAQAIVKALRGGLKKAGLNEDIVCLIDDCSRESAMALMTATGFVDLLIPRGGSGLIKTCVENAKVPCIQTGTGVCHIYVDEKADFNMALSVIENAKCSRPSVCNAMEVCLVSSAIAEKFLPLLHEKLTLCRVQNPVKFLLDEAAYSVIGGRENCFRAGERDFDTEFLDYVLAVAVVDGVEAAINHISLHSTGHSDGIITSSPETAQRFTSAVDSAAVYVNASTRFTDGGEFGFGCEIGISTQKLHARGPMGLKELTSFKYVVEGDGNVR